MKSSRILAVAGLLATLPSCGGSSGQGQSSPPAPSYPFVVPALNSQRTYSETITDNSNNTIDLSYEVIVIEVSTNDSYTVHQFDPTGGTDIVNGTDYSMRDETLAVNGSGQVTSSSYIAADGTTVNCTDQPHGAGPPFPLVIGATWSVSYTVDCTGLAPVSFTQNGTVEAVEQVTVPAGTYSTIRLRSTLSWTDAAGRTHDEMVTNWRDAATLVSVKESNTYTYSGPFPTHGFPVSSEIVLQGGH